MLENVPLLFVKHVQILYHGNVQTSYCSGRRNMMHFCVPEMNLFWSEMHKLIGKSKHLVKMVTEVDTKWL